MEKYTTLYLLTFECLDKMAYRKVKNPQAFINELLTLITALLPRRSDKHQPKRNWQYKTQINISRVISQKSLKK